MSLVTPPLSLYVHLPWCVRKCPYCDFNSHHQPKQLPVDAYVDALVRDLEQDLPLAWGRTVHTVFFGGGTPSLFPPAAIGAILEAASARLRFAPGAEVTLEPNTVFAARPPQGIPDIDDSWDIQEACQARIAQAGFEHYEVSAYAKPGRQSQHNLNYWRFGDYLGIGAGAHGKLTFPHRVVRQTRFRDPARYMTEALAGSVM